MPAALAMNFGLLQLTMVLGPGLGGLLIAALRHLSAQLPEGVSGRPAIG